MGVWASLDTFLKEKLFSCVLDECWFSKIARIYIYFCFLYYPVQGKLFLILKFQKGTKKLKIKIFCWEKYFLKKVTIKRKEKKTFLMKIIFQHYVLLLVFLNQIWTKVLLPSLNTNVLTCNLILRPFYLGKNPVNFASNFL